MARLLKGVVMKSAQKKNNKPKNNYDASAIKAMRGFAG
jgi:hypothetical protein